MVMQQVPGIPQEVLFNDLTAPLYDLVAMPFVSISREQIAQELSGLPAGGSVLEVGSGTGLVSTYLARQLSLSITGVEPSPGMLARARQRAEIEGVKVGFISGRAEELPFPDRQFDGLVMCFVLRYIKPESFPSVMAQAYRVLRPGGWLVLVDMFLPLSGRFPQGLAPTNPSYVILGTLAIYDPPALARALEQVGFVTKSLSYTIPISFLLSMVRG